MSENMVVGVTVGVIVWVLVSRVLLSFGDDELSTQDDNERWMKDRVQSPDPTVVNGLTTIRRWRRWRRR